MDSKSQLKDFQDKRTARMLKAMKGLLNYQVECIEKSHKLVGGVKPQLDKLEAEIRALQKDSISKEGYLHVKTGDLVGGWQKVWLVLKNGFLCMEEKGKKSQVITFTKII